MAVMWYMSNPHLLSKAEMWWLTRNIYYEARGEGLYGQVLVGVTTLQRRDSGRWGETVKDVVTAPRQFSWYNNTHLDHIPDNETSWRKAKRAAYLAILINSYLGKEFKMTHYHATSIQPSWADSDKIVMQEGNHVFYRGIH